MQKLPNGSPPPDSKMGKILRLLQSGKTQKEVAKEMGMKWNILGSNVHQLRKRGLIPPSDKCRSDFKPPKTPLERIRERESTGLAFQQIKKVDAPAESPVYPLEEVDVPVTRRQKRGTSMLVQLAQLLDNEIHQHVRDGGKLGRIERQALILIQEVMRS